MIEQYLDQASSYANEIDQCVNVITLLTGVWGTLSMVLLVGLVIAFRDRGQRGQYISGEEKHHHRWISIPHLLVLVCDVVILVAAIRVWVDVKQTLPEPDRTVRVISQQWAWSFVHPGPDGKLDTPDDIRTVDDLYLEVDKTYHYKLVSRDVMHSFSIPVFRLTQDSVPGRVITGWFKPIKTGTYDIQCKEMCGVGHGLMPARVIIQDEAAHAKWMAARSKPSGRTFAALGTK